MAAEVQLLVPADRELSGQVARPSYVPHMIA